MEGGDAYTSRYAAATGIGDRSQDVKRGTLTPHTAQAPALRSIAAGIGQPARSLLISPALSSAACSAGGVRRCAASV